MKNVKTYQKKTKKILGAFSKKTLDPVPVDDIEQGIAILIEAVDLDNFTESKGRKTV